MSQHVCPHCNTTNEEHPNTPITVVKAVLPLLLAAAATEIGSKNSKAGLAFAGGVYASNIARYINGKMITCGNCDKNYQA